MKPLTRIFRCKLHYHVFVIAICVVLISAGCKFHNTDQPVTLQNLFGIWSPDDQSLRMLKINNKTKSDIELILSSNQSFELKNFPSCWENPYLTCEGDIASSYKGSWQLIKGKNENYELALDIGNRKNIHTIEIEASSSGIYLNFLVGDPDSQRTISMIKQVK